MAELFRKGLSKWVWRTAPWPRREAEAPIEKPRLANAQLIYSNV